MTASRRAFLQSSVLLTMPTPGLRRSGLLAVMLGQTKEQPTHDSLSFGIDANGKFLDHISLYSVPKTISAQDRLCFDVSNNRISGSINARGMLERIVIQTGVAPVEARSTPAGAYVDKILFRAGPWPILVTIGVGKPVRLDELPQPEVYLEDNLFPRYEWTLDNLKLRMLVFAPQFQAQRPRALITLWSTHAPNGAELPRVQIVPGLLAGRLVEGVSQTFPVRLLSDRNGRWLPTKAEESLTITPQPTALAVILATDAVELENTHTELLAQPAVQWWRRTKEHRRSAYGKVSIPESPYYADLYTRAAELTRQSLLLNTDSLFGGSFNGSDLPAASTVWMRDCFYSSLPQALFNPDLSAAAILFFLRWGVPGRTLGDHADRFPGATGVTNSLGNSVAGIVLAGAHYAANGDREFFLKHPEILNHSLEILNQILLSRREDVFLFPSIYVSDGESRGDFHTGSNIFLWRAFVSFARLAEEVYDRPDLSTEWQTHAHRLREAIHTNCIILEDGHPRFVEGAMQDHTKIGGHDGEESDLTLAAVYDFCQPDDEPYLRAAREAVSPSNPYAIPELDGVWWYAHFKWSSATFPGWTTALAASFDEANLLKHLERIRTLTDADGSFWWWPYTHDTPLRLDHPLRVSSKCGWAAGVYVSFFTRHILGISVDAPKRTLAFRPFSPWKEFSWTGCRIGSITCDLAYSNRDGEIELTVRNRNAHPMQITLQAMLPTGTELLSNASEQKRYGRPAPALTQEVAPGAQLNFIVSYTARSK